VGGIWKPVYFSSGDGYDSYTKNEKKLPIFQLKNSQNSFLKSRIFFSNLPKNKNSFSLIELDVKSDIIFPQLSLSTFSFLHA